MKIKEFSEDLGVDSPPNLHFTPNLQFTPNLHFLKKSILLPWPLIGKGQGKRSFKGHNKRTGKGKGKV